MAEKEVMAVMNQKEYVGATINRQGSERTDEHICLKCVNKG